MKPVTTDRVAPITNAIAIDKPYDTINKICANLTPHAQYVELNNNNNAPLYFNEQDYCYLLLEGNVALIRQQDDLIVGWETAPFIFGLSNAHPFSPLTLSASENARLLCLPRQKAFELFSQLQLWESLTTVLVYITDRIFQHCKRVSQVTAYQTVRFLLLEFMQESPQVRERIPALYYIQRRCHLSRSGIMGILARLQKGKYITIHRGRLQALIRLPKRI